MQNLYLMSWIDKQSGEWKFVDFKIDDETQNAYNHATHLAIIHGNPEQIFNLNVWSDWGGYFGWYPFHIVR